MLAQSFPEPFVKKIEGAGSRMKACKLCYQYEHTQIIRHFTKEMVNVFLMNC